jgi:long-subunit acyl-CoA synthetase (AMP-forming)
MVRGSNVMAGYWNRPEETAAALTPDGWLRTGDAARPDEDGYIWIIGRVADSFISRGQVVHPGDVERFFSATRRSPTQASCQCQHPAKNK